MRLRHHGTFGPVKREHDGAQAELFRPQSRLPSCENLRVAEQAGGSAVAVAPYLSIKPDLNYARGFGRPPRHCRFVRMPVPSQSLTV